MSNPAVDRPPLVARTHRIDNPGPLLTFAPPHAHVWLHGKDGFIAWGRTASAEFTGPNAFAEAETWWNGIVSDTVVRNEVGVSGSGLVAVGSFAFDLETGTSQLIVPEVVVGRRDETFWVTTIGPVTQKPELMPAEPAVRPSEPQFSDGALSASAWAETVAAAIERINAGSLDKVVLARDVVADFAEPLDVRWPLERLAGQYPSCWTFHIDGFFGSTPEMLVRRERGLVASRVLAGTIRRSGDDTHDLALAASLARSSKDREEHGYAVKSVVDALESHCASMNVPEAPYVLHLPNVMHLATDVTGVARNGSSALALAASLHPSAAVGGTPRDAAMSVIRELEGMDRGAYAGPVGWVDAAGDGEWGIGLRSAQIDASGRRVRLFAGCGIVADSDPESELAESNAKLIPVRNALS